MNEVIKFPDMRPPKREVPVPEPPPPSQYRLRSPTILASEVLAAAPPPDRRRLYLWLGVAVALHAALFLAIWLTPPLRLKWSPSPSDWVQVVSLPPPESAASAPAATPAANAADAAVGKHASGHKPKSPAPMP